MVNSQTLNLAVSSKLDDLPVGLACRGKDRCSACERERKAYDRRRQRTSLICFMVSFHLFTSPFVCSYAASRSRRSCARKANGAERVLPVLAEASVFADFLSESTWSLDDVNDASKSSSLSFVVSGR
jgi:hypothetical protein